MMKYLKWYRFCLDISMLKYFLKIVFGGHFNYVYDACNLFSADKLRKQMFSDFKTVVLLRKLKVLINAGVRENSWLGSCQKWQKVLFIPLRLRSTF